MPPEPTSPIDPTSSAAHKAAQAQQIQAQEVAQEVSESSFAEWSDEASFSTNLFRRFESLEGKIRRKGKEEEADKTEKTGELILEVEGVEAVSEEYSRKNPELQQRSLLFLRAQIKKGDTHEDILRKVLEVYPDPSLADEVLDFLLETASGELATEVRQAKHNLNTTHGREVRAGRNISEQTWEASKQGLGTTSALRNLYRTITGHPRDANTLFNELTHQFNFDQMKPIIDFLLHSLGQDLKSKGPSIERAELHRLISEGRSMQAILGIFRFFKSRMHLITNTFQRLGIPLPTRISFELLAKLFMALLQERYPSPEKVLQMAAHLGLLEELLGQICIYTQMRDAIRQTAPKLFRSDQHRQDVLTSLIDTIEDLDEELEDKEEKEEE